MTAYQQAGQWNNMNINTDRHLQKQQKPLILHGKRVNQYWRIGWHYERVGGKWQEVSRYKGIDLFMN